MKLKVTVAFLLCFLTSTLFAQSDASISTRIDANQILIGDQAHVFLEIKHDANKSNIQWANLTDSLGKLEIVQKGKIDTLSKDGFTFYKRRIDITGFDSGAFYFPSLSFSVIPKNGSPYALESDSLPIIVQTVAVDTTKDYKPIKGIIMVSSSWRDYIGIIVGVIVFLALLIFVIFYFLKNKRHKLDQKPQPPTITLQEKAMQLLQELDAKQLWQQNQVKSYYIELTEIVRGYVEARFDTPALELTTDELLNKSKKMKDLFRIAPELETILRTADLAKFAKAQPNPIEHTDAMDAAKAIIQKTPNVVIINPENQK